MYGTKRIVLSKRVAVHSGHCMVIMAGGHGYHSIGVWYAEGGKYFADLRSPEQKWTTVRSTELGIKRFGGCATKAALRTEIMKLKGTE